MAITFKFPDSTTQFARTLCKLHTVISYLCLNATVYLNHEKFI